MLVKISNLSNYKVLQLLNTLKNKGLSDTEIKLVTLLIQLEEGKLTVKENTHFILSSLNITKNSLNNYISKLRKLSFINENNQIEDIDIKRLVNNRVEITFNYESK